MIAIIISLIVGAVCGALGIMIAVIALTDKDKKDGKWWQ